MRPILGYPDPVAPHVLDKGNSRIATSNRGVGGKKEREGPPSSSRGFCCSINNKGPARHGKKEKKGANRTALLQKERREGEAFSAGVGLLDDRQKFQGE